MSKAILGFGVSVTRLAALAGSKLASTPSNDDIVKSPGVWTGVQNVCQNIFYDGLNVAMISFYGNLLDITGMVEVCSEYLQLRVHL